jgi:hypothetical protein
VKTFWSVFHSYHRLLLLLVLLACLAPQITIFAPILQETTSSATGESNSERVGDLQVGDSSSHAQSLINQAAAVASVTRTDSMVEPISAPPPSEQSVDASVAWVASAGQELLKADPPTLNLSCQPSSRCVSPFLKHPPHSHLAGGHLYTRFHGQKRLKIIFIS